MTITRVKSAPVSARKNISANLIVARASAGFTQARLAEAAGVTRQTISDLERGAVNISVDVLDRIAAALEIDVQQFFTPRFAGVIDAAEIARRRETRRSEFVPARALSAAIREAGDAEPSGKGQSRVRR